MAVLPHQRSGLKPPEIPPMAIFHLSVKTISRSAGRSATAAIAYRAGEKVTDERTGVVHDYSRKRGIEHTELFLPENSPEWASDRGALWNAAEQAETRKNSTVAREFEVAMPAELNQAERLALVREFATELVKRHGMAVDVAIHEPGKDGDHRNHHAHILCSTRRLTPEGFTEKTRELDDQKSGEIVHWRARWAELSNRHLENAGHQERVDHRSLAAQRAVAVEQGETEQAAELDRMPTVHMGPKVVKMEQRGIRTDRGDENRVARHYNIQVVDLAEVRGRIEAAQAEVAKEALAFGLVQRELTPASLNEVLQDRQPTEAANEPTKTVSLNPERVKAEWQAEKAKQFSLIVNRAQKVHARAAVMAARQEAKLARHEEVKPTEPTGLFAGFKKATHEQALAAWGGVRAEIEKRWNQLYKRVHLVSDYMRKAASYGRGPSKGELLAEKKAAAACPELATTFHQVIKTEKEEMLQALRAKEEQRQQDKQEPTNTATEMFGERKAAIVRELARSIQADRREPAALDAIEPEPVPQAESLDAQASFLRILEQEMSLVREGAQRLAARNKKELESERAREAQVRKKIQGLKQPGLLSGGAAKQRYADQERELHVEGQAAMDGQMYARRGLKQAEDMETSPKAFAIERINGRDPGLVARMVPMLKDARLLDDARRHLKQQREHEVAVSRARLGKEILAGKAQGPERGR